MPRGLKRKVLPPAPAGAGERRNVDTKDEEESKRQRPRQTARRAGAGADAAGDDVDMTPPPLRPQPPPPPPHTHRQRGMSLDASMVPFQFCPHVNAISPEKVLRQIKAPATWRCKGCDITDGCCLCLHCGHIGCGRQQQMHALQHFQDVKHPLIMDLNDSHVFCYECDEWVTEDDPQGSISLARELLQSVKSQVYAESTTRFGRVFRKTQQQWNLRPRGTIDGCALPGLSRAAQAKQMLADRFESAVKHHNIVLCRRTFSAWRTFLQTRGGDMLTPTPIAVETPSALSQPSTLGSVDSSQTTAIFEPKSVLPPPSVTPVVGTRRPAGLIPGRAGLRNLGNTCYINSVVQCMSFASQFRQYFLHSFTPTYRMRRTGRLVLDVAAAEAGVTTATPSLMAVDVQSPPIPESLAAASPPPLMPEPGDMPPAPMLARQATVVVYTEVMQKKTKKQQASEQVSLCVELHRVLRLLWSGRWAVVTPYSLLYAIWHSVPQFRCYQQQDAQEFVTAFLDALNEELKSGGARAPDVAPFGAGPEDQLIVDATRTSTALLGGTTDEDASQADEEFERVLQLVQTKRPGLLGGSGGGASSRSSRSAARPAGAVDGVGVRCPLAHDADVHVSGMIAGSQVQCTCGCRGKYGLMQFALHAGHPSIAALTLYDGTPLAAVTAEEAISRHNAHKRQQELEEAEAAKPALENLKTLAAAFSKVKDTLPGAPKAPAAATPEKPAPKKKTVIVGGSPVPTSTPKRANARVRSQSFSTPTTEEASAVPCFAPSPFIENTMFSASQTAIECQNCHNVSSRVEAFSCLSLRLPNPSAASANTAATAAAGPASSGNSKFISLPAAPTKHLKWTIDELLQLFTRTESLEGDAKYDCERCASKQVASSRTLIYRTAPLMWVHVNRVEWKGIAKREKRHDHVQFPLDELDMAPFMASDRKDAHLSTKYRLVGVCCHSGRGIDSGHYSSYCRDTTRDAWLSVNDTKVEVISPKDVEKAQAYLLLYERLDAE